MPYNKEIVVFNDGDENQSNPKVGQTFYLELDERLFNVCKQYPKDGRILMGFQNDGAVDQILPLPNKLRDGRSWDAALLNDLFRAFFWIHHGEGLDLDYWIVDAELAQSEDDEDKNAGYLFCELVARCVIENKTVHLEPDIFSGFSESSGKDLH